MNRKEFFKSIGAVFGSLALAKDLRPADFSRLREEATGENEESFWKLVRDQFVLDPDWTYLNFGGLGACPCRSSIVLPSGTGAKNGLRTQGMTKNSGQM